MPVPRRPKPVLLGFISGPPNTAVLVMLKASTRNCARSDSVKMKLLLSDMSNWGGEGSRKDEMRSGVVRSVSTGRWNQTGLVHPFTNPLPEAFGCRVRPVGLAWVGSSRVQVLKYISATLSSMMG